MFTINLKILVFYIIISTVLLLVNAKTGNKYSKEANSNKEQPVDDHDFRPISLKHLDRPFRMAKLNLLWSKAVHVNLLEFV